MPEITLPGEPPVAVSLRRSARARRFSLRVSRLDGRVTLTLPMGAPQAEALAFLQARAGWVRGHLARQPDLHRVELGSVLPVAGQPRRVGRAMDGPPRLDGAQLLVGPRARAIGPQAEAVLREEARARLTDAALRAARVYGRTVTGITLKDTRSRWGSCSAQGRLMFSWRLVLAPSEVLDYVAIHEAAHLVEMNHSRAFWAQVARLCPDYAAHRDWLRVHGAGLHRFRFRD